MKIVTVGRDTINNVVINDAKVSREHLQLVLNDKGVYSVVDLNTTNGTYVNNHRITGEVTLSKDDIIRIGDTIINWQDYIQPKSSCKSSHSRLYAVICCAIICTFLTGGAIFYFTYYKQEHKKIDTEQLDRIQLRDDVGAKAAEAKRLQDDADELYRQVLTSQNAKNHKLAIAKQKEADAAKRLAEEAQTALLKAEADKLAAEEAKINSEKAQHVAELNSQKALDEANRTEQQAQNAISKANKERDLANESMKLTATFYKEYAQLSNKSAKQICEILHFSLPDNESNPKSLIETQFIKADNDIKQKIIDTIRNVKQSKDKRTHISVSESEENEEQADSTITND